MKHNCQGNPIWVCLSCHMCCCYGSPVSPNKSVVLPLGSQTLLAQSILQEPIKVLMLKQIQQHLPICTCSGWLNDTNADVSSIHETWMLPRKSKRNYYDYFYFRLSRGFLSDTPWHKKSQLRVTAPQKAFVHCTGVEFIPRCTRAGTAQKVRAAWACSTPPDPHTLPSWLLYKSTK